MKSTGLRLLVRPGDRHEHIGDRLYWAKPEEAGELLKKGFVFFKDYNLHEDTKAIMKRNKRV